MEKVAEGKLVLAPPAAPTQSLGAFITPVAVAASSAQEGRAASKLIDGSGWGETFRGSGVYVHTNNVYDAGGSMWNGAGSEAASWVQFDLGKAYRLAGMYVWNYNEAGGWANRSVREMDVLAGPDAAHLAPVGPFTPAAASGKDDDRGQAIAFKTPVSARFVRFEIHSNHRGNDVAGLAEVRFANADEAPAAVAAWQPTYPRPTYPKVKQGAALPGAENRVFPADLGLVDVSKAPYAAKGDGVADDSDAIQRALDDHPGQGAIIYLPNGVYRLTKQVRFASMSGDENTVKLTTLQGQSQAGTILQLADGCAHFDEPRRPRGVLYTGYAPAQRFGNEVRNLTIDAGLNNPGVCGLQFMANNQGGVYDVTIQSGDGQGVVGLDMAYTDEEGPLLIKHVTVRGFDVGVATATSLASETMEHVTLLHQNVAGLRNAGQAVSIRDLRSTNAVPAVVNGAGLVTLIDCILTGTGGVASAAVVNEGNLLVCNLHTTDYRVAVDDRAGQRQLTEAVVKEYRYPTPTTLLSAPVGTLNLPIQDTPEVPWDDLADWRAPQRGPGGGDDSAAIQAAIDSGGTTVYLPHGEYRLGHPIILRGKLRRLIGGKANLVAVEPLRNQDLPMFRLEEGEAPVVRLENLTTDFGRGPYCFAEHASKRTLVLAGLLINLQATAAYRNDPARGVGPVFIEDVAGAMFTFHHQQAWARQFNSEMNTVPGLHVLNDGGTLWSLGFKTEGGGTQLETRAGGQTEIVGGLIGDSSAGKLAPMFVNRDSQVSVTVEEVCFNHDPFDKLVEETRGNETRRWTKDEALSGPRPILYEGWLAR